LKFGKLELCPELLLKDLGLLVGTNLDLVLVLASESTEVLRNGLLTSFDFGTNDEAFVVGAATVIVLIVMVLGCSSVVDVNEDCLDSENENDESSSDCGSIKVGFLPKESDDLGCSDSPLEPRKVVLELDLGVS